ncbi:group II intron reverse transcriptase/maturase [Tetragenococcus halophilus]|uniref:group II intron reverse transcriptase/maturase n=1 Tax=Tetragenococcus halophilus TaxID=51669 RepID=UPI0030F49E85
MYRKNPSLMEIVVRRENLEAAVQSVKRNKGAAGIDGMTVFEIEEHIKEYYIPLRNKLLKGSYQPQPVKRVEIPKPNGKKRKLGIPCVRDRVIQQAIRQVIEPIIDPYFMENSHGFRPRRGTHSALKQCVQYYKEGYRVVVDCDLKECFDTLNHDKLIHYLGQYIQDKMIIKVIRKFLLAGVINLSGEYAQSKTGAPQGGVLSPLLSNVYLHELDKELAKRGHKFVRYADDFVIYVKSKRAGERVMKSVTRYIEKDLKLIVNKEKSKVGSPTRLKFLSCLMFQVNGTYRFIPTKQAKQKFKTSLRKLTSRKRPGSFEEIIQQINRVTRGWINYFGLGFIKKFIEEIEGWLNHRLRQLILKRWKRPRTVIRKLKSYGLDLDSAKRIAFSRKKYWRLSQTPEVHWAITTKRLHQWGLVPLSQLVESAYARY